MRIIDCHVHPQAVKDYFPAVERLVRAMQSHGIEQMIASDLGDGWKAFPDAETVAQANQRLRQAAGRWAALNYLVYLNPQLENWCDELHEHAATACGVKLWISLSTPENGFERTIEVLHEAAKLNLPVLIHTFERTGGVMPGAAGVEEIIALAQAAPETTIVAAHACGSWRRAIKNAKRFPKNILFDVSGSYPERNMVKRLAAAFGADRLLYGSDAYGRSFGSQLSKVLFAGLSEDDLDKVLYRNAMQIFKLSPLPKLEFSRQARLEIAAPECDNFCLTGKSEFFDQSVELDELVKSASAAGFSKLYTADLSVFAAGNRVLANRAFAEKAAAFPAVHPLAAADLSNPEHALAQLEDMTGFCGIFISPYLDNYRLDYAINKEFFDICAKRRIPIWINTAVSDDRFRCSKLAARTVIGEDILQFIRQAPENCYTIQAAAHLLMSDIELPEYVFWECSRLADSEYLPEELLKKYPERIKQLCWGSEYPFRDHHGVKAILQGRI